MARERARGFLLVILASALLVILAAGSAFAQDAKADQWVPDPSQAQKTEPASEEILGRDVQPVSVLGILGKLALVAGLIYAAAWGLKMWQERDIGESRTGAGGLIHIRESVSLGAAGRLYAVKFGERNLLLATIGERVEVLADASDAPPGKEELDPLAALADGNGDGRRKRPGNGSSVRPSESPAAWAKKRDMLIQSLQEADA